MKKVRFPRQLVPFSVVATQLVTFAAMLAILIVLSLVFVPRARPYVVLSIPLSLLFLGFVAGLALIVASLNVVLRDVEHCSTAALLPWFFLTPVLWSFDALPADVQGHETLLRCSSGGTSSARRSRRCATRSGSAPRRPRPT